MWSSDNMKKSKLELKGVSNDYNPRYTWPERGDVDFFLSKLVPKGQIADCIRIREATEDTAMVKIE